MKVSFIDFKIQNKSIKKEIDKAIEHVINSGSFILGDDVRVFEEEFASYCGVKYAVGVNSGTDALFLGLLGLDIGKDDEVIIPSFTYIATALAVSFTGAKPVFVDIDEKTYNIDINKIKSVITNRTKAIAPVHLYGHPVDMEPLLKVSKRYGLKVVEDCAQAHGAEYNRKPQTAKFTPLDSKHLTGHKPQKVGSIGDIGCFSFYPTKNLGAFGDGGMVVTNNKSIRNTLVMLRDYGRKSRYQHLIKGRNSRLDTLQGAILKVKLRKLDEWNQLRRKNALIYNELFREVGDNVVTPWEADYARHVYHLYVVRIRKRYKVREYLLKKGIQTLIHYPIPIHLQRAYGDLRYKKGDFPVTEKLSREVLSLPMYPELTKKQIEFVAEELKKAVIASKK